MKIILSGNPQSTNHIYKRHGNFIYLSKPGKDLKTSYAWQLKSQYHGEPITENIHLSLKLFFGDKRIRDIDNYNKLILDACTGILWEDDKQIISLLIVKDYDKANPRIEMSLSTVSLLDC